MKLNFTQGPDGELVVTDSNGNVIPADTIDIVNGKPSILYIGTFSFSGSVDVGTPAAPDSPPANGTTPAPAPTPTPAPTPSPSTPAS
jgi:hypothetical protein